MLNYIAKNQLSENDLLQLENFESSCRITLYYHEYGNCSFPCFHMLVDENGKILSYLGIYGIDEKTAELSGATLTAYRNKGMFLQLFSTVSGLLKENGIKTIYCNQCPSLSYLIFQYAYSEFLFKKNPVLSPAPCVMTRCIRPFDRSKGGELDLYYVVFFINIPVGLFHITGSASFACIHNVKIRKSYRGQGYGMTLLQCGLEHFFNTYHCPVYLHVSSKNSTAVSLYKRCGFKKIDEVKYYRITT